MTPKPKEPMKDECDKAAGSELMDQPRRHGYYYDDAHGYEEYDPSREDEDDVDEPDKKAERSLGGI